MNTRNINTYLVPLFATALVACSGVARPPRGGAAPDPAGVSEPMPAMEQPKEQPPPQAEAKLAGVSLTVPQSALKRNTSFRYAAIGRYTDRSERDLTNLCDWSSSDESVVAVRNSGDRGVATALRPGAALISARCYDFVATSEMSVSAAELTALIISPPSIRLPNGVAQQFTAIARYDDGSAEDVTGMAAWRTNDALVASVDNRGMAQSVDPGAVEVHALFGDQDAVAEFSVSAAELTELILEAPDPSIARGTRVQLGLSGRYTDASVVDLTAQALWGSSDDAVARFSEESGLVRGTGEGSAILSATFGGQRSELSLTVRTAELVSIEMTAPEASIARGTRFQLVATGRFTDDSLQDLTTSVEWISADVNLVAFDSGAGLAIGVGEGQVEIEARHEGKSASVWLSVSAAELKFIEVSAPNDSLVKGLRQQYVALGHFSDDSIQDLSADVMWESSDDSVIAFESSDGLALAFGEGSADVIARFRDVAGSVGLTVLPAELIGLNISSEIAPTISRGEQLKFSAGAVYSDGAIIDVTDDVEWSVSDPNLAMFSANEDSKGLLHALAPGKLTVRATFRDQAAEMPVTIR